MIRVNPVQGIEGATVIFRGKKTADPLPTMTTPAPELPEGAKKPEGILLKLQPVPPAGVGTKLDIMA